MVEEEREREDVHQGWWMYSVLSLNHSLPPPPTLPLSNHYPPAPTTKANSVKPAA